MTPLDFSGYVPGIVNNGPGYRPPTLIEICQALELQIKMLKKQLGDLSEDEFDTFKQTVNASFTSIQETLDVLSPAVISLQGAMETAQEDIGALELALPGKEDKSNKSGVIDDESTDTQYPTSKAVYEALEAVYSDLSDLSEAIAEKADGNSTGAAKLTAAIPCGKLDSTSTATVMTATVPGITELKDGVCVFLQNGVITSASGFTLNINGLGAKPVYSSMAAATRVTTAWNSAYTMLFVYNEDRVSGGCWDMYYGIDNNTNTIGYQVRTNSYSLPMMSIVYRYRLLFTSADGAHFVPANNSTSTNATSSRSVCQDPIDPHGPIVYYGTTASVAAGSRPAVANLWQQYLVTLGYSFNRTGAALTLTSWKPLYVKATPQANGSAIIDSTTPYVQALPTTADGFIYIFLGVAISATQIELNLVHPVYYHDGTALRIWTGPIS